MLAIESPYPQFFDLDGKPLDAGYVYVGQENQNPETSPVTAYWDAGLTQPAAQPLRTKNGLLARNGTPAHVFTASSHSMMVRNVAKKQVVYAPSSRQFGPSGNSGTYTSYPNKAAAEEAKIDSASPSIHIEGYYTAGDGGGAQYRRVFGEPAHSGKIKSADGAWWELADESINVLQFGAVADGDSSSFTNNRDAFQRAVNCCLATRRGAVKIPGGVYGIDGTVFIVLPDTASVGNGRSCDLVGSSGRASKIIQKNPANGVPIFAVTGAGPDLGAVQDLHWRDFSMYTANSGVGMAVSLKLVGHSKFENIVTFEFDRHWDIEDSLVVLFDRCRSSWGGNGFSFTRNSFTHPNAITFLSCTIGGMYRWGARFQGAAGVKFLSGSIEGNGKAGETSGGIQFNSGGNEGAIGLQVSGTYFEYNNGTADIEINASPTYSQLHSIAGLFNRAGTSHNTINSIRVNTDAGYGRVMVDYTGSAFVSFGGYVPSPATKRINIAGVGPVKCLGTATFTDELEADGSRGAMPHAEAVINSSAALLQGNNIASIDHPDVGRYRITYRYPKTGVAHVDVSADEAVLTQLFEDSATVCEIRTFDPDGAPTDPGLISVRVFAQMAG